MKIEYTKVGDYYLPNLVATENIKNFKLGKYGKLRLNYLKDFKKAEYTILLMDNKLQKHLMQIDKQGNDRFEILMKQLIEKENIVIYPKEDNELFTKHSLILRQNSLDNLNKLKEKYGISIYKLIHISLKNVLDDIKM